MLVVLEAVSESDFADWVVRKKRELAEAAAGADRDWTMAELMERGQRVYTSTCITCHQANGQGLPPTFPALTGSAVTTGPLQEHLNVVLNGRPGTTMQAFGQQLNTVDLASVIIFERNAPGSSVGDMVQPLEVKAAFGN